MKLSDIKGDCVIEVIADIIDPISNIAANDDAKGLFSKQKLPEGMAPKKSNKKKLEELKKYNKEQAEIIQSGSMGEELALTEADYVLDCCRFSR